MIPNKKTVKVGQPDTGVDLKPIKSDPVWQSVHSCSSSESRPHSWPQNRILRTDRTRGMEATEKPLVPTSTATARVKKERSQERKKIQSLAQIKAYELVLKDLEHTGQQIASLKHLVNVAVQGNRESTQGGYVHPPASLKFSESPTQKISLLNEVTHEPEREPTQNAHRKVSSSQPAISRAFSPPVVVISESDKEIKVPLRAKIQKMLQRKNSALKKQKALIVTRDNPPQAATKNNLGAKKVLLSRRRGVMKGKKPDDTRREPRASRHQNTIDIIDTTDRETPIPPLPTPKDIGTTFEEANGLSHKRIGPRVAGTRIETEETGRHETRVAERYPEVPATPSLEMHHENFSWDACPVEGCRAGFSCLNSFQAMCSHISLYHPCESAQPVLDRKYLIDNGYYYCMYRDPLGRTCNRLFTHMEQCMLHHTSDHGLIFPIYQCQACGTLFRHEGHLYSHTVLAHPHSMNYRW